MQVSRSLEYAVRSLVCLASSEEPMGLKAIAEREKIPLPYLAKIMRLMVQGGLVDSTKGRKGGYRLTKKPSAIRLYDIYRLTDGSDKLIPCIDDGSFCWAQKFCSQKPVWMKVEKAINEAFKKVTLDEMLPKKKDEGVREDGRAADQLS